jgi:hypothetical protein
VSLQVALSEWSNMDNAQVNNPRHCSTLSHTNNNTENLQLREVLEAGQILFQEEFAQVSASQPEHPSQSHVDKHDAA